MADLERFETDLVAMLYLYNVDDHVTVPADVLGRKVMEYLEVVRACHAEGRDLETMEVNLVTRPVAVTREVVAPQPIEPHHFEPPPDLRCARPGCMVPFTSHDKLVPEPRPCWCGWSNAIHDRSEHEPRWTEVTGRNVRTDSRPTGAIVPSGDEVRYHVDDAVDYLVDGTWYPGRVVDVREVRPVADLATVKPLYVIVSLGVRNPPTFEITDVGRLRRRADRSSGSDTESS